MDSVRVTAKTVEDALLEASILLGTSSDNLEYTVIDEGSKGFFGIGGRKAIIEAKKKFTDEDLMKEIFEEKVPKSKKEGKKEYKKESKPESKPGKKENRESKENRDNRENREAKKEPRKETRPEKAEEKQEGDREPGKEPGRKEPRKDAARYGKPSGRKNKPVRPQEDEEHTEKEQPTENVPRTPKIPADPAEAKRRAEVFLKDVFSSMDMKVEIDSEFEDDTLSVNIQGDDMGLLIGKRGQTLDSLQYLTSLVVNKGKASYVRVKLDTEDYRNRRKATLENLAKNIALKVKKTRRPVFLEPMNPYERRIIHSALQNDPYVTTHSEGDEPYRKVVVTLRKDKEKSHTPGKYGDRPDRQRRQHRPKTQDLYVSEESPEFTGTESITEFSETESLEQVTEAAQQSADGSETEAAGE